MAKGGASRRRPAARRNARRNPAARARDNLRRSGSNALTRGSMAGLDRVLRAATGRGLTEVRNRNRGARYR